MKYHTIRNERFNTRENGSFADYPIYEHITGLQVGILECYSCDIDYFLKLANDKGNIDFKPFWKE